MLSIKIHQKYHQRESKICVWDIPRYAEHVCHLDEVNFLTPNGGSEERILYGNNEHNLLLLLLFKSIIINFIVI